MHAKTSKLLVNINFLYLVWMGMLVSNWALVLANVIPMTGWLLLFNLVLLLLGFLLLFKPNLLKLSGSPVKIVENTMIILFFLSAFLTLLLFYDTGYVGMR